MRMWEASRFSCEEAFFFLGVVIIGLSDFDLLVRWGRWWSLQRWSSSCSRDDDQCGESWEGGRNDQMKPTAASPSKEPIRLCQDMFTKVNIQTTCETRWKQASKLSRLLLLASLDQIIRNNETKECAKTPIRRYSFPLDAVIAEADFVNILKSCFKRLSVARGRLTSWPWLATAPPLSPRSIINLAGRWSYHTARTQDDWCYTTHRATWSRHQGSHSFSALPLHFSSFNKAFMKSFSSDAVFFFYKV